MRAILFSVVVCVFVSSLASAADNEKQVEVALRNYGEVAAKANEVRTKAVDKARNDAIGQLTKLAAKAFAEKDRVSETNAWKAVLTLDRSHAKATRYFKDLGTLERVLEEISKQSAGDTPKAARINGRWRGYRDSQARTSFCEWNFLPDGTYLIKNGTEDFRPAGKYKVEDDAIVVQAGDGVISRFTVIGNRLLHEQWADGYPNAAPNWYYYGIRVE